MEDIQNNDLLHLLLACFKDFGNMREILLMEENLYQLIGSLLYPLQKFYNFIQYLDLKLSLVGFRIEKEPC